ncbi:hypothetical protein [Chryseobacterium vrystaatense]|uniref:Uncharacterized protein n=1 Tax=Chryseobacterium vrystaatense TaxID=307480 RepID=A0A1M5HMX9_9FLAO|nr:hypothetical protein [Chryseobacterium vrystaatense]SHG17300.1 hypothetical protein SAMN02787073_3754 [Chryseobacterium vrystaatense]
MSIPETVNFKATQVDAGVSHLRHIHKDHLKWGSIQITRVDFRSRSLAKIMATIAENVPTNAPYIQTPQQVQIYEECIEWVNDHYS